MKICKECHISLDIAMFNKNATYPDGLMGICKACAYLRNKKSKQILRERKRIEKESWVPDPTIFKHCSACGESKSQLEYYYNPDYKDRCHIRCKSCEIAKISVRNKTTAENSRVQKQQEFNQYIERGIKQCRKCSRDKVFTEFPVNNRSSDKRGSYCKECLVEIDRINHSQYYSANKHIIIDKVHKFYHENKVQISKESREDRKLNPEKYRLSDKKHSLDRMWRIRGATIDPNFRLSAHYKNLEKWQRGYCFHCLRKMEEIHVDHIVPLAKNGKHSGENTALSCPDCNLSKSDKLLYVEWNPETIFRVSEQEMYLSSDEITGILDGKADWKIKPTRNGVILSGNKDVPVFVLSSFLTSDRNPYSFKRAITLKKENPDAIILFDFELDRRLLNVVNMLTAKTGIASRFPARKLNFQVIDTSEARSFLDTHHLMGFGAATIHVGLKDDDGILFGVGSFFNRGAYYENIRLAFSGHVAGGMSKIVSGLWKLEGILPVVSYVDSRYANGSGHETIGFTNLGMTPPGYRWLFPNKNQHYRYLNNDNKIINNLQWIDTQYDLETNIKINGVAKLGMPPLHKIRLEPK